MFKRAWTTILSWNPEMWYEEARSMMLLIRGIYLKLKDISKRTSIGHRLALFASSVSVG